MDSKRAIVLAGGASHGAYHVGVLKALLTGKSPGTDNQPLDPNIVAGISAGAFNAAALLSRMEAGDPAPADSLEDVWLKRLAESKKRQKNGVYRFRGDLSELLNPLSLVTAGPFRPLRWAFEDTAKLSREAMRRGANFASSSDTLQTRLIQQVNVSSFVSMKPFKKSIRKSIDFERLRNAKRFLQVGSVNWEEGKMEYFNKEQMTDKEGPEIIRASAAVPGIFPRVKLNGAPYCDGAAVENTPLSGAIRAGGRELHVITSVPTVKCVPVQKLPNTVDTLYRFIIIRAAATLRQDIEAARAINHSLSCFENHEETAEPSDDDTRVFMKNAGQVYERYQRKSPYSKVVIHVYQPSKSLGGIIGLLNFDRKFLSRMIQKGYDDTINHDCERNGCVLL